MQRSIEITSPPEATDDLLDTLKHNEHVIGLSVDRDTSIKPPGDVITVHALNRGIDDVMRAAEAAHRHGSISIVSSTLDSVVDPEHADKVASDVDEGLWEEAETGLRHQGRITANFLVLMAVGGVAAATGFLSPPTTLVIAFVAASIIAPGFEPIAKLPIGIALRRPGVALKGLRSAAAGYLVLALGAALTFVILRALDLTSAEIFLENSEVGHLVHPSGPDLVRSICGALAGVLMIVANRRSVIAGPLIVLSLVPAAAMVGMAATLGRGDLMLEGLQRLGIDIALIVVLGALVVAWKQATVHRRRPMV